MFSSFLSSFQGKEEEEENGEEGKERQGETGGVGLMNVAASVMSTMREDVDDLVTSFRTTNWTNEILSFGRAVQSETTEAIRSIEGLPERMTHNLPGMSSMSHRLGTGIQQLALGTKELFNQAVGTIEAELGMHQASSDNPGEPSKKFSRFEADVMAMQRNSSTYCDEPEDREDFEQWKASFDVVDREEDIQKLTTENTFMAELHKRIVPVVVEHEVFWIRYFYRLHKLQETHEQRQQLAERAQRVEEEEQQLRWDDEEPAPSNEKEPEEAQETVLRAVVNEGEDDGPGSAWESTNAVQTETVHQQEPTSKEDKVEKPSTTAAAKVEYNDDSDIDEDWGDWD